MLRSAATLLVALLVGLAPLAGCSCADTAPGLADGGRRLDAGLEDGSDAALNLDASGPLLTGRVTCDDDDADPDACCVGSAEPTCCQGSGVRRLLDLTGCPDGAFADCAPFDQAVFGVVDPTVRDAALYLGDGVNLAGVALGPGYDPRGFNADLSARVVVPEALCDGCIDVAGVALLDRVPDGAERAPMRVALLANRAIGQAQLVIAGEEDYTFNLPTGTAELWLRTFIDGGVEIEITGERPTTYRIEIPLPERLVPVVLGRAVDPGPAGPIAVREAAFQTRPCDAPAALRPAEAPVLTSVEAPRLGRPSVVVHGGERLLFFASSGAIQVATSAPDGALGPASPALEPQANEQLSDPWVVADPAGLALYVRSDDPDLGARVLRVAAGDRVFDRDAATVELTAQDLGVDAIGAVTVFEDVARSAPRMVAHVLERSGQAAFWLLEPEPGGNGWRPVAPRIATANAGDLFAFDRDVIEGPAMIYAGGLYRLYYAGRRGTRWTIGAYVSPDLERFYPVGPVLAPRDEGYDAIAISAPAPFVTGGRVGLYYLASDGVRTSLSVAGPSGT